MNVHLSFVHRLFVVLATVTALSAVRTIRADWYSGDPYTAPTAWPQFTDNLSNAFQTLGLTYDNFTWVPGTGGGVVDRVGGHFHTFDSPFPPINTAYWEIRTGMAHNVAGALVTSGSGAVTSYLTSFAQGGWPVWAVDVDVPDFTLPAGNYWFGLAVGTTINPNTAGWFVASTTGANGVGGPLGDDLSIYFQSNNSVVNWDYVDGTTVVGTESAGLDPSYWIREVPEPSSAVLAVLAAVELIYRRRRRAG
jgi:hypothetical protein